MEEHSYLRLKISLLSLIFSTAAASWWAPALNAGKQNVMTILSTNLVMEIGEDNNNKTTGGHVQPGHGEEEDGVGVAAAGGVLAHTLVRLQRLSTRDEEDLERQTVDGGESLGKTPKQVFC